MDFQEFEFKLSEAGAESQDSTPSRIYDMVHTIAPKKQEDQVDQVEHGKGLKIEGLVKHEPAMPGLRIKDGLKSERLVLHLNTDIISRTLWCRFLCLHNLS